MDWAMKPLYPAMSPGFRGRLSVRRAFTLQHVKSTLEPPDTRTRNSLATGSSRRPIVMERRHWFGNRLRWAAEVVREERAHRRNQQEKLF
jgi:hypothetical protein